MTKTEAKKKARIDPTAKRPNQICDPYGQNDQPLSYTEANLNLQTILHSRWHLVLSHHEQSSPSSSHDEENSNEQTTPKSIRTEFHHTDFYTASKFISQLAALAHNHHHYPKLTLERRLFKKEKCWKIVSRVDLCTVALGGLSYHYFHLGMLIDLEVERDAVRDLWLDDDKK